ncbi:MAG: para-aminobenzoate synthetase component 1 [Myxococcota bacterium]
MRAPSPVQYPLPRGLPTTPQAVFEALRSRESCFWLDSGNRPGRHARFHHLGSDATLIGTDLDTLLTPEHHAPQPRPAVRRVALVAYENGKHFERLTTPPGSTPEPQSWFGDYDACVSFDMVTRSAWITAADRAAGARLEQRLSNQPARSPLTSADYGRPSIPTTATAFAEMVTDTLEYIAAGDVYQVNLSHRISVELPEHTAPSDVYLALRTANPAAMGAFVDCGSVAILSNSPEVFLDVDGRRVATFPLKGTRPIAADPNTLVDSEKDRAEHIMIVDLVRNDLGRVAVPGTVRVTELMSVVSHPTVHHLESRIEAETPPGTSLMALFGATFPGGSITGAPKIRAMQIISELEGKPRGIYCGALGAIDWCGERSLWNIPIRTGVIADGELSFRVGGGIVADSDPAAEYQETLDKARAFLDIIGPVDPEGRR